MENLMEFFKTYPEAMLLIIILTAFAVAILGIFLDTLARSKNIKEFEDIVENEKAKDI